MMMTSGVSLMNHFQTGQGIQSIEQRVQQLESRIQQLTGDNKPSSDFQKTLSSMGQSGMSSSAATESGLQGQSLQVSGDIKTRFLTLQPIINALSEKHGLDNKLVNAVVRQESGFRPDAVSSAGAQGLMQLMPATAKALGVTNTFNPVENLDGGMRYLKGLIAQFHGNIPLALAAYNAGPNAVKKYGDVPPYKETQQYVRSILGNYLRQ